MKTKHGQIDGNHDRESILKCAELFKYAKFVLDFSTIYHFLAKIK